jgi:benzoyl-CoA reductase subunit BamB
MGAVMGDKNLKAIAVRGSKDIQIARPEEFIEHCNEALKFIKKRDKNPIPGVMPILAGLGSPQEMQIHDEKWHTENFMWGNARERRRDFWTEEIQEKWTDTMETMRTRLLSCHNCPMKCGASIAVDKRFCSYMMKCFSKLTYGWTRSPAHRRWPSPSSSTKRAFLPTKTWRECPPRTICASTGCST